MANELRLDIIVDDHGAVQTLQKVDASVKGVQQSTEGAKVSAEGMGAALGGASGAMNGFVSIAARAVSIGAVAGFIRNVTDEAGKLNDASERIQVSASRLQQLSNAAAESGVSMETLVSAIGRLQVRVGDGQIDEALTALKINLDEFKQMNAADQFAAVAEALGKIEDPTIRAAAAVEIFGRTGEQLRPILTKAFSESADAAVAMSDRTIDAFDRAGDAVLRFWQIVKVAGAEFIAAPGNASDAAAEAGIGLIERLTGRESALSRNRRGAGTSRGGDVELPVMSVEPPRLVPSHSLGAGGLPRHPSESATPVGGGTNVTVNAQGAFFDTPQSMDRMVRMIEERIAERSGLRGKVSR